MSFLILIKKADRERGSQKIRWVCGDRLIEGGKKERKREG